MPPQKDPGKGTHLPAQRASQRLQAAAQAKHQAPAQAQPTTQQLSVQASKQACAPQPPAQAPGASCHEARESSRAWGLRQARLRGQAPRELLSHPLVHPPGLTGIITPAVQMAASKARRLPA